MLEGSLILVCDDEPAVRFTVREALVSAGHRVIEAASAEDGLAHLADVDVVISDLVMGGMSGLDFVRRVRELERDLPVILLTARGSERIAVEAMKAGAHDYLIKGHLARLGAAIEREVREAEVRRDRRKGEQELREARLRLQALSNRMLQVQEAECRHIARELHDEIGQSLTAIKLNLDALQRRLKDHAALPLATDITAIAELLLEQVRRMSLELRIRTAPGEGCEIVASFAAPY